MTVECVVDARNRLGEVPVWDVAEQALYWVDIEGKLLQRLTPATGTVDRWQMPERIACFALRENGGLIVAFASGIAFYDLDTGAIDWIAKPEAHIPTTRFNEGKCDRQGRFWAGTMDDRLTEHSGALYRVDPDRSVTKVLDGIGISNTLVWSLDDTEFYFADTLDGVIDRFDYDPATGAIANRTRIVDLAGTGIGPDGSTIDAEGYLWNAQWDGWRLARYAPDGTLDRIVELPVQKPTSCMFGGPDLRTLYVTSAIWDLTPEQLRDQPQAGGLFALDVGIAGVPETRFAG
ncbi:SMP-30/gluconolactonase/LRE family protein [Bauldia litoralis]|uniref:SMP-30/gluconolactonase/LRE family protein n=1 Tax=Bauldia litoralis TaxID=665467 RepID=UPI0032656740